MRSQPAIRLAISALLFAGCSDTLEVKPLYNPANGRVVLETNQDISGKDLYMRVRRGSFGKLDCKKMKGELEAVETTSDSRIDGPFVDPALTKQFYDGPQWMNPTPEMLAQIQNGTDSIIDVCLMDGDDVVVEMERDLFRAWDDARRSGLGGKADDPASGEQHINSPVAYGERCVGELGEIPFFEKNGDGDYSTYNCLDSTEIPLTVTKPDGSVEKPREGTVSQCDNPQYIYSLCEAGPRVATKTNEQGTRWTLLCRKSIGGYASDKYNDIAMIGHNPFTGKTCFFQNALYSKTDGGKIPHPADKTKSQNLWAGVHGGLGEGIQCSSCHDADPFIHSPWIDGAKDAQGRPIVPKMGIDPDLAIGANDTPYSLINAKGQGWRMQKQIVSPEANACLKCHRMGDGRWAKDWLARLDGTDASWTGITTAAFNMSTHRYWMPPDQAFDTDAQWTSSVFASALTFIKECGKNPSNPACIFQDVPTRLAGDEAGGALRNPVSLPDDELAKQATTLIGMNKNAPSTVCAECHAANQTTLRDWQEKTDTALATCLKNTTDGGVATTDTLSATIAKDELKTWGPYEVALGGKIEVKMTGTGDADLYVKRNEEPTLESYDCRPFSREPNETCDATKFNVNGPGKFYVGAVGFAASSKITITVTYGKPGPNTPKAADIVDCMRLEPGRSDSPYVPGKVGVFAAAAHLGFFQAVFKAAFPQGENGNTKDTWALEYGKFKNRTSMPKGNHPRLTQGELDIVAEWFARGLPRLTTYIAPDTGPTSCTQNISSAVGAHVNAMATAGWGATNRSANIRMYGCGNSTNPLECLTSMPEAQTKSYGTGWPVSGRGKLRVLRELTFNTYYWMRSSPDGRFVANGATGGDGAVISDLQSNKDMKVKAAYDPGFFPDNRGWMFQGTPIGSGMCSMGLLVRNPDRIDFSEGECSHVEGVSLYQHLGSGLGGGDYFAVNSQFTSDNPSGAVTRDPSSAFGNTAQMKFTAMMFDGTRYTGKPSVSTQSPYEGDSVLSPSTKLVISRFGNENEHLGYVLRRLDATPSGSSYTVSTPEIARYCVKGAKPAISFDEKFFVVHHYVGANDWQELGFASANDPTFQEMLNKGTSNIYLVDMVTGASTRITNMKPGQYALFPHWRSDNWIYFLVRDKSSNKEYVVASDAAMVW